MSHRFSFLRHPRRRSILAFLVVAALGLGVRTALAAGSCVDTCVGTFGVSFYNSAGDYFLFKDCATSDISGTTYCTYSRLRAME